MRRIAPLALAASLVVVPNAFAQSPLDEPIHESTWSAVDLEGSTPEGLRSPAGRTRWEFEGLRTRGCWKRSVRERGDGRLEVHESGSERDVVAVFDPTARPHLMPHVSGDWTTLEYDLLVDGGTERHRLLRKPLGAGWVFLPSGPREALLERVQRAVQSPDGTRWTLDRVTYRWVDPRAGVVARSWGSPTPDGEAIARLDGAETVEEVIRGGVGLKIYSEEIGQAPFERLALGFDRMGTCTDDGVTACTTDADCAGDCRIPVADVTTVAHATIGNLIAAASWDFSVNQLANSRYEIGSINVPINMDETCSYDQCGFATTTNMGREDKNFTDPNNVFITLSAQETEQRAGDVTIWLRAGIRNEGIADGGLGENESRFCYEGSDGDGRPRPEVPLWRFPNQDMPGEDFYMQVGDAWSHTPFNCEQSVFNHVCPNGCGFGCEIWIEGCSGLPGEGTQSSEVIGEGPVTLPGGHVINTLLVRQVVDFCVYIGSSCLFESESVHQVIYLWVAPNIGTVARLMSEQDASDNTSFDILMETDIKYGLFPPVSMTVDGVSDTTIDISWDPGSVTHHIDGHRVYWDTDSGTSSGYAFNSVDNAGQVSITGTSATISGLDPNTDYYVTVTSVGDYTDVATGVTMTYESLLFPRATSGAGAPLPAELMATTTGGVCTPMDEITGVTVSQLVQGIEMCWDATMDVCVDGYSILGADAPELAGNFSTLVGDTGLVTCHSFDPATEGYFLVIGKGSGGSGPWGHYGQ